MTIIPARRRWFREHLTSSQVTGIRRPLGTRIARAGQRGASEVPSQWPGSPVGSTTGTRKATQESSPSSASPRSKARHGSSHYDLPGILRWFTANIGVHHVHHLCSRIPYYRLPRVLRDHPELGATGQLTLLQSLRCVRLVLWDEDRRRLISFRDMGRCYIRDCKVG